MGPLQFGSGLFLPFVLFFLLCTFHSMRLLIEFPKNSFTLLCLCIVVSSGQKTVLTFSAWQTLKHPSKPSTGFFEPLKAFSNAQFPLSPCYFCTLYSVEFIAWYCCLPCGFLTYCEMLKGKDWVLIYSWLSALTSESKNRDSKYWQRSSGIGVGTHSVMTLNIFSHPPIFHVIWMIWTQWSFIFYFPGYVLFSD